MYSILQSRVNRYILDQLLVSNPILENINGSLYVSCDEYDEIYISCGSTRITDSLEYLISKGKTKCCGKEIIAHILKIYGFDNSLFGHKILDFTLNIINYRAYCSLNGFVIGNEETGDRLLLLLLCDPFRFITMMDQKIRVSKVGILFDILKYCIHDLVCVHNTKWLYICQLLADGVLINDVWNIVVSKYLDILINCVLV